MVTKFNTLFDLAIAVDSFYGIDECVNAVLRTFDIAPTNLPFRLCTEYSETRIINRKGKDAERPMHFTYENALNKFRHSTFINGVEYLDFHFHKGQVGNLDELYGTLLTPEEKAERLQGYYNHKNDPGYAEAIKINRDRYVSENAEYLKQYDYDRYHNDPVRHDYMLNCSLIQGRRIWEKDGVLKRWSTIHHQHKTVQDAVDNGWTPTNNYAE